MYYIFDSSVGVMIDSHKPIGKCIVRDEYPIPSTDMANPSLRIDVSADKLWYEHRSAPTPETQEQKQARYEALSAQYIHEQYSIDKEQSITRKAIAYPADTEVEAKFVAYNNYAEQCKARAHTEVFGK